MLLFKNTNRKMFRLIASLFVFVAFTLGGVGITRANAACTESQIDVNGDGTLCETAKFTLTTTNYTSVGGTFTFQISAAGTFYVDCGDGGTLSGTGVTGNTIDRTNNTNEDIYTCTYSTTGTKTIRFGGLATNYSTGTTTAAIQFGNFTGNTVSKIASISGSLSAMFPYITQNASDGAQPRFSYTFYGATNLTSIPDTLFSGYTTGAQTMFYYTFGGCTGLTSIPATLFSSFTSGAFGMFSGTFWNCSNITGYIPPSTFAGLIANGAPKYNNMWGSTFAGTQLVETCPTGTVQYITGYEGTDTTNKTLWNGKVSCVSTTPMAITLDTTGATTAATPSTVYLSYDTGWYSDANGTAAITGLTTLPTKSGKLFGGFYTGENGTGTQVVDANGNIVSGNLKFTVQPTTLFATWVESKFTLTTTNYTS
ncbi:MAG: hypothetical protein J6Y07_02610, partial [Alphaproteobacteria bacterium]|nr:hypothetical protein [Alphaproteobacteria bacterium]